MQHQRQQAMRLGLLRQQRGHQPAEPDRFLGEVAAADFGAGGIGPPLREGGVDGGQHGRQTLAQVGALGQPERDAGLGDLPLRAHQPLAHGGGRDQERRGDAWRHRNRARSAGSSGRECLDRSPDGRRRTSTGGDRPEFASRSPPPLPAPPGSISDARRHPHGSAAGERRRSSCAAPPPSTTPPGWRGCRQRANPPKRPQRPPTKRPRRPPRRGCAPPERRPACRSSPAPPLRRPRGQAGRFPAACVAPSLQAIWAT